MEWHSCDNPPKKNGCYLLAYKYDDMEIFPGPIYTWDKVFYFAANNEWEIYIGHQHESLNILHDVFIPVKWAEVGLP